MEKEMGTQNGISRRAFLGIGAVAAVAAGLSGCAPQSQGSTTNTSLSSSGSAAPTDTNAGAVDTSWMNPPAEVTDFAKEYECDVVVAGHGFAGITAAREIAEEGKHVILIEKQPEESYAATGNEFASLNAAVLQERGVPHIDPVEFYQNFMKITANQPNPSLVMAFAQNSEANSNWYLDHLTEEELSTMTTAFFPPTEHQLSELSGIKFWPSVCSFYGGCNQTRIQMSNQEAAEDTGNAEFLFGTTAEYVIMEDGAVAGIVASDSDGYIKFTCKAVVLACGGMGGNPDMMAYFMPDMARALTEGENLTSMSANDGRGVQMAYWAGAHLETTPIPGMNMKGLSVPGKMNCLPQAVWLDENGQRFCNEFYPTAEQRGYQTAYMSRQTKYAVVDNNFPTYRQYTIPQHAGFDATEANIQSLRDALDEAYAKFNGTYVEPAEDESAQNTAMEAAPSGEGGAPAGGPEGGPGGGGGGPMTDAEYIADDTLEGLASQLGLTGEAATNFVESINQWNTFCENGVDEQFGRATEVLFPVNTPPYYAVKFDPALGETMVTMGGILTDGKQNAVDKDYNPIPGLYMSGNDCGRRFGYEYVTPIPGCSLAFALVLGRECGKHVVEFLES